MVREAKPRDRWRGRGTKGKCLFTSSSAKQVVVVGVGGDALNKKNILYV